MFIFKLLLRILMNMAILGGPLFLLADTVAWWRAWVFLGVYFIGAVGMAVSLSSHKDLLNERLKAPIQQEQPLGDKLVLLLFIATFVGLLIFIPLDVFRFHLLGAPGLIVSAGGLPLVVAGLGLIFLSLKENAFAVPVVKNQSERHQMVIATGVYGMVRHPMYAGLILTRRVRGRRRGIRLWASFALVFGLLLAYAIVPSLRAF